MKVFLVEDSVPIRQRLVEMIEADGAHKVVGEADNYADAVSGIARSHPDVAIFDIKLASGNGIQALAEARRRQPTLLGIVMSNHATPQHRKASAEAGAAYFLDKSSDFEQIPQILCALAAKQSKECTCVSSSHKKHAWSIPSPPRAQPAWPPTPEAT